MCMEDYSEICRFVLARRVETGGFNASPTLAASVQDTYYALRILKSLPGLCQDELGSVMKDSCLESYLQYIDKNCQFSFKTIFQYLYSCSLLCMNLDERWSRRFFAERLMKTNTFADIYYCIRILREIYNSFVNVSEKDIRSFTKNWNTAEQLSMLLYINNGSCRGLSGSNEDLITWLQMCQTPDGGFGGMPGTTSFIEKCHSCLRALSLLNAAPLRPEKARSFIMRCKTADGGFARKNGGAPFLDATWHAVASLNILRSLCGI